MGSIDRKLRGFLLTRSPAWLTDRLLGLSHARSRADGRVACRGCWLGPCAVVRRELDRALRVDDGVEWEDAWSLGRHGRLSR